MTVVHVDQNLKALLQEGRISVADAEIAKPVIGPWKPGRVVTYT